MTTLRNAKELTEERKRTADEKSKREHENGLAMAAKEIEAAHAAGKNRVTTTGLPDSVLAELLAKGYVAKRVKPDDNVGPGYAGEVEITWD